VSSSIEEKYGMDLLNAWVRAKPVIAFDTESNLELFGIKDIASDMVFDNKGIIVKESDEMILNLEKAILELLNDANKSEELGKSGKEHVKNNYTWETFISKYYEIYKN
ncbi:MAG: glycosyltransferase, partial [Candidatus Helarchaeota archaeon]